MKKVLFCINFAGSPFDSAISSEQVYSFSKSGWSVSIYAISGAPTPAERQKLLRAGIQVHTRSASTLMEVVSTLRADVCVLDSWLCGEYTIPIIRSISPATRMLVTSEELLPLRIRRENSARMSTEAMGELSQELLAELDIYSASDGAIVYSDEHGLLLRSLLGKCFPVFRAPIVVSPATPPRSFNERAGICVLADVRHPRDSQTIETICQQILPRLSSATRSRHKLTVISSKVGRLGKLAAESADVNFVGAVPDTTPYLAGARVFLSPFDGRAHSVDVVRAMSFGTPVVAALSLTEWLDVEPNTDTIIVDSLADLASNLEILLNDETRWAQFSGRGTDRARDRHSSEAAEKVFASMLSAHDGWTPTSIPYVDAMSFESRVRRSNALLLSYELQNQLNGIAEPGARIAVAIESGSDLPFFDDFAVELFDMRVPAGQQPADGPSMVALAQEARTRGVSCIIFTESSFDSLSNAPALLDYLEANTVEIASLPKFRIFSLTGVELVAQRPTPAVSSSGAPSADLPFPEVPTTHRSRLFAFYLPQYYPIPENNAWWQPGFTEWTNVAKRTPLFDGHDQPRLPSDLGYYDLRSHETRDLQMEMAKAYGLEGFCYYHYWFHGKRLLNRPFDETRASDSDFPFALCWANEPWSRRWNGSDAEVLQPQHYSRADDLEHIQWLLPVLADDRAIKVNGRPLFLIYRPQSMPDAAATIDLWRTEAERAGLPGIYLMSVETGWDVGRDPTSFGFDATVLFAPEFNLLDTVRRFRHDGPSTLRVYPYDEAWQVLSRPTPVPYRRYPCVFPQWDNSPRMGESGVVVHGGTPETYEKWLGSAIEEVSKYPPDERLVFVNAWNEWAEGAHLEPDLSHGRGFLEATRRAVSVAPKGGREA